MLIQLQVTFLFVSIQWYLSNAVKSIQTINHGSLNTRAKFLTRRKEFIFSEGWGKKSCSKGSQKNEIKKARETYKDKTAVTLKSGDMRTAWKLRVQNND